jgi:hypothetical protein
MQSMFAKMKSDFKSLSDALQSGDLSDAQTAYATLQKDMPAGSANSSSNPLSAIGTALQSGNIAGAQQAFAALQQTHGGHHHHHGGASSTTATTDTTDPTDTDGTSGTNLSAIA